MKKVSKPKSSKTKAKRSWKKTLIWVVLIVAISVTVASFAIVAVVDYLGYGTETEQTVEIPKGSSTAQIADVLKEKGVVSSEIAFRAYSKFKNYDGKYNYGVYTFSGDDSYDDICLKLQEQGQPADSVSVMIPDGASVDKIASILAKNKVCTKEEFFEAQRSGNYGYSFVSEIPVDKVHYRFEGYLYPDTYNFYTYGGVECAEDAINKMLSNFDKKFNLVMRNKAENMGYSIHEITSMASILQMEAGSATKNDQRKVAAVFYNRLSWDEPKLLGSSPTASYKYGNGKYNTNVTEGLPPGPLCSPTAEIIESALNPEKGFKSTYFVTDEDMKFYYTNSLSEHNAIIAKLKSQGKWL